MIKALSVSKIDCPILSGEIVASSICHRHTDLDCIRKSDLNIRVCLGKRLGYLIHVELIIANLLGIDVLSYVVFDI